jgi:tetratricopeptide (TPR) repeat protein
MSDTAQSAASIDALGRASRRAAALSLLGVVVVLGAIGYAAFELRKIEQQRAATQQQLESVQRELITVEQRRASTQQQLETVEQALITARASLAAARAAINAFHAGRLTDAVKLYDEALAADPDNAYLQNLRAYALFRLGRTDAAIEGQRQSLKSRPDYAWGYFDLARFLCSASPARLDEARQAAATAIQMRADLQEIMRSDGEFQRVCQRKIP